MYSRTLGIPSGAVYCSAMLGSSRIRRATISAISSVGNVPGLGNPPASERTPGGGPARIAASSLPLVDTELERALLAGVEPGDVLRVVGEVVHRAAFAHGGEHGALGAGDRLAAFERGGDPVGRRDDQPVVVAEDDVAGVDVHAAEADPLAQRGARRRGAGGGNRPAREEREPEPAQPADVAAQTVDHDPGNAAALRLGREQLAAARPAPAGVDDDEHVS